MSNYKKQRDANNLQLAKNIQNNMPAIMVHYLRNRGTGLSSNTLLSYTNKLYIFSQFMCLELSRFYNTEPVELTLNDIASVSSDEIVSFIYWMRSERKVKQGDAITTLRPNSDKSINNYLSCINSFYARLVREKKLENNPVVSIDRPSILKSDIVIHLKEDEQKRFMNTVEFGTGLDTRPLKFHQKNKCRDTAICQLFLNTGIRVSELVGLDVADVDLNDCSIIVTRKRNKRQEVFFSDVTASYLQDYLSERSVIYKPSDEESALFLSRNGTRLGVRSIEKMVKRYIQVSNPAKEDVTPHKLRSTYAMRTLEKSNGNHELVREGLGHETLAIVTTYARASQNLLKDSRNLLDN